MFLHVFNFWGQTKVGNVFFNDVDTFENYELMLNGAGSRDKLYAAALYLDFEVDGANDGLRVADKNATMAITIKSLGNLSNETLNEMIRTGLERATDGNSYLLEDDIRKFLSILPKEINKYEIFKLIYDKEKGLVIYKNKDRLGVMQNSLEFKKALFQIWLGENPVDEQLKRDLLSSVDVNPILGRWKAYDKKTGVAWGIVQLYMIKNRVYGTIEQMLRQSERDAVCYECEGDDKNQKVEGLVVLKRLMEKGTNKYGNGKYTNIKTGEVADCQIWIDDEEKDILNIKYKGGGTHNWKRIQETKRQRVDQLEYQTAKGF